MPSLWSEAWEKWDGKDPWADIKLSQPAPVIIINVAIKVSCSWETKPPTNWWGCYQKGWEWENWKTKIRCYFLCLPRIILHLTFVSLCFICSFLLVLSLKKFSLIQPPVDGNGHSSPNDTWLLSVPASDTDWPESLCFWFSGRKSGLIQLGSKVYFHSE